MKYFAILKDSLREALDSKVLHVMLALSTFIILLVGTLTFKPVSAEKTMAMFFPDPELKGISLMFLAYYNHELRELNESPFEQPKLERDRDDPLAKLQRFASYRLEKVELASGEPDSPSSDYLLTVVDLFPRHLDGKDRQAQVQQGRSGVQEIFQRAADLGLIRIGTIDVEPIGDDKAFAVRYRYCVALHATPQTPRLWGAEPSIFFVLPLPVPAAPLGYQLYILSRVVILIGSWIAINVGVIVTSFFIPSMLTKGTVDLLLAKPIHRWALFAYKYVGGLTFIFLNGAYAIGGMWLAIGLRSGIWPTGCLLLILTTTFFFAILYAISAYVSVVTRSTIASIVLTLLAWIAFFAIGWGQGKFQEIHREEQRAQRRGTAVPIEKQWGDGRIANTVNFFHRIVPRTEDLNQLNDLIVYCDVVTGSQENAATLGLTRRADFGSVFVAGVWIVLFLGIAATVFTFKDY